MPRDANGVSKGHTLDPGNDRVPNLPVRGLVPLIKIKCVCAEPS